MNYFNIKKVFLFIFIFIETSIFSQDWLKNLTFEEQKKSIHNFEFEQEEFYKFWNKEGKTRFERGEKIEGYKDFKRREIKYQRDKGWKGTTEELFNNVKNFRLQTISERSSNCFYNDTFVHQYPSIVKNMGSGVIGSVFYNESDKSIWIGGKPGGLYKTTDYGNTWVDKGKKLPFFNVSSININPFDNNHIIVANYETRNGGQTWSNYTTVMFGASWNIKEAFAFFDQIPGKSIFSGYNFSNGTTGTFISFDNLNSATLVSSIEFDQFKFVPGSNLIIYANNSNGIYKSIDGGLTWIKTSCPSIGWSLIAVSNANPNIVYVSTYTTSPAKIYKSLDQGVTWNLINSTHIITGQTGWNNAFAVSSKNENHLIFGTVRTYLSKDGGLTFNIQNSYDYCGTLSYLQSRDSHVDQHDFVVIPNSDTVLIGNDGGFFIHDFLTDTIVQTISTPQCFTIGPACNGNYYNRTDKLDIGEVYGFDFETSNKNAAVIGLWHNGSSLVNKDTLFGVNFGDGFDCWSNPLNNNEYYVSSQSGFINRNTKSPQSSVAIGIQSNFQTAFRLDKKNSNILYLLSHSNTLKRSINKGDNWKTISTSLYNVKDFDIHPLQNNYIYSLSSFSQMDALYHYSSDTGNTWQTVSVILPSSSQTQKLRVNRNIPSTVYLTTYSNTVHKSINFSPNLIDITYNLPSISIEAFEIDDINGLYVGTTSAVYYLADGSTQWVEIGKNLPFIPINIMRIDNIRKKLYVGTDGRGVWSIKLPTYIQQIQDTLLICPNTPLTVNTIQYFSPGYYTDTIKGINGCDSIFQNLFLIDGTSLPPCISSDINQLEQSSITIYPNPSKDAITINGFTNKANIYMYNGMGQLILKKENINSGKIEINTSTFSEGIYVVKIIQDGNYIMYKYFVKN